MEEYDGLELDGELVESPLTLKELAEIDLNIERSYAYCASCPEEIKAFLQPVVSLACDFFCELCYQMGIDPVTANFKEYFQVVISEKGDEEDE